MRVKERRRAYQRVVMIKKEMNEKKRRRINKIT
jgi:hypothetical protein